MNFSLPKNQFEIVIPPGKYEVPHLTSINNSVHIKGFQVSLNGATGFLTLTGEQTDVVIDDVTFENFGDTVISFRGRKLSLNRCVFRRNSAPSVGGAAVFADAQNIELVDCLFEENTGRQGGALLISGLTEALIQRCIFKQNAAVQGGAIRVREGVHLDIIESTFENNRATGPNSFSAPGACIYASGTTSRQAEVSIKNTKFFSHVDAIHGDLHAESNAKIQLS